jgi:hypothetical protein
MNNHIVHRCVTGPDGKCTVPWHDHTKTDAGVAPPAPSAEPGNRVLAAPASPTSRRFGLRRYSDVSGVSGTGIVADGVLFEDGSVALRWRGKAPATAVWASIELMLVAHGHEGATVIEWYDPATGPDAITDQAIDAAAWSIHDSECTCGSLDDHGDLYVTKAIDALTAATPHLGLVTQ